MSSNNHDYSTRNGLRGEPITLDQGKLRGVAAEPTNTYSTGEDFDETPFATAYVVVTLNCETPTIAPLRLSLSEVDALHVVRGERRQFERGTHDGQGILELSLPDRHLSSKHAAISRDASSDEYQLIDLGSKNGTYLNGVRTRNSKLRDGDLIGVGSTILLFRSGVGRFPREPIDVDASVFSDPFATLSPPFARDITRLARCAPTDLSILLTGESGTGKEVAARWLHQRSGRQGPFIAINCGALPEALVESELFGVRRGAFSGADRNRLGLIRASSGGTLFLDEIAELPLAAQVKLLRVLQEKEVTAVGDTGSVKVDLRVISATLQDIDRLVQAGAFRPDLLARISGFRFSLPRLRDRPEDIGMLIGQFVAKYRDAASSDTSVRFDRGSVQALLTYPWPFNARELEQTIHSAIALAGERRISLADLPNDIQAMSMTQRPRGRLDSSDEEALKMELIAQLRAHRGNISAVAREMGKARVQVRRWCERFNLNVNDFRGK